MTFEILLDVATGLVLVFVITSILSSSMNEVIAAYFNRRGRLLEQAVYKLLDGSSPDRSIIAHLFSRNAAINNLRDTKARSLGDEFFNDPLIRLLSSKGRLPSFIDETIVAKVIEKVLDRHANIPDEEKNIKTVTPQAGLLYSMKEGQIFIDIDGVPLTEKVYRHQMERVSGWYKRRTQLSLFVIGFSLAILLDINAITIARHLSADANLREQVTAYALAYELDLEENSASLANVRSNFNNAYQELSELCLPIGRGFFCKGSGSDSDNPSGIISGAATSSENECIPRSNFTESLAAIESGIFAPSNNICKGNAVETTAAQPIASNVETDPSILVLILGWFVTGVAAALGAPFWFDLLGKLVNVRSTGPQGGSTKDSNKSNKSHSDTSEHEGIPRTTVTDTGSPEPRVITLNAYEASMTDDDCIDVALILGFDEPGGKSILYDPKFRAAVRREKEKMGEQDSDYLTAQFVTSLFTR